MNATTPLAMALHQIASGQVKKLGKQVPAALSGQTSGVHQSRVATRRIRSLLGAYEDVISRKHQKTFRKPLRALARALGEVRDLDVLNQNLVEWLDETSDESELVTLLGTFREGALQRLQRAFPAQAVQSLSSEILRVTEALTQAPSPRLCERLPQDLWSQYVALRAFEVGIADAPVSVLHELRIEIKRFRYALEFFADALGSDDTEGLLEPLVLLQDALGRLNDLEFAESWLVRNGGSESLLDFVRSEMADARRTALTEVPKLFDRHYRANLGLLVAGL